MSAAAERGRRAARLVLAAALAVAAAYQVEGTVDIPASGALAALTYRDMYGAEGETRWTRDRSAIVFPDPGPGRDVIVELDVSGWRPPRLEAPHVRIEAAGRGMDAQPSRQGETLALRTRTVGAWSSDLHVSIVSETFAPGPQDPRALGVRVAGARLVPAAAPRRAHVPPLRPLLATSLGVLLLFGLLLRLGLSPAGAERAGWAGALVAGAAFAFERPWAAVSAAPAAVVLGALVLLSAAAPRAARLAVDVLGGAWAALGRGVRGLTPAATVGIVVLSALATTVAYRAHPSLDFDIGSGREAPRARGLGPYEGGGGVTFRQALRGASLDLADFGGGDLWTITVTASLAGRPRTLVVARADGAILEEALDGSWTTGAFGVRPGVGWRSGPRLSFPSGDLGLRLDRVRVERGRSLPSGRLVAATACLGLLAAILMGALGLPPLSRGAAAVLLILAEAVSLARDPVTTVPFALTLLAIAAAALLLALALAGALEALARRGTAPLPSVCLAAAAAGFGGWLAALSFPLYRGGHFVFHSSIAEEIWKGRFLIYYLPYPGSMLSRQAQWGDIVVPHPCLYHALISPLAALPQPFFYLAEKAVLALMLAALALAASAVATRVAGGRAGAFTAVLAAGLVPTYQLLGLGHLMTILGCLAMTLATAALILRFQALAEGGTFWALSLLLTFCFLSYTAALLFEGFVLLAAVPLLWRRAPREARALGLAAVVAALLAFVLYYMNWAWPFLAQSVPRILHGSAAHAAAKTTPVLSRLALLPDKLAYSYGSAFVPIVGFLGLLLLERSPQRTLLVLWGGILWAFSGVDLYFNLLLKHHYFAMAPVAIGGGVFLARLSESGRVGRAAAVVLLLLVLLLGLETGLAVALGEIP